MRDGDKLSAGQVAKLFGVDLKTVHNWQARGRLEGAKTPGGHRRFDRATVAAALRAGGYPVPADLLPAQRVEQGASAPDHGAPAAAPETPPASEPSAQSAAGTRPYSGAEASP